MCGTNVLIHISTSFWSLLSATNNTTFSMYLFRAG